MCLLGPCRPSCRARDLLANHPANGPKLFASSCRGDFEKTGQIPTAVFALGGAEAVRDGKMVIEGQTARSELQHEPARPSRSRTCIRHASHRSAFQRTLRQSPIDDKTYPLPPASA